MMQRVRRVTPSNSRALQLGKKVVFEHVNAIGDAFSSFE